MEIEPTKFELKLAAPYIYFTCGTTVALTCLIVLKRYLNKLEDLEILYSFIGALGTCMVFNIFYLPISKRLFHYEISKDYLVRYFFIKKAYSWNSIHSISLSRNDVRIELNNGEKIVWVLFLKKEDAKKFKPLWNWNM